MTCALAALAGAASGAPAACNLAKVADLPVTMVGSSPLVAVKVNGLDGRLVADTGSFFSMLTPAGAARFGLKLGPLPPWLNIRGATGAADVHAASARDFSVLGLELHNVDFLVGEHGFGPGADGLLGENVMSLTDAEFDLANGVIRLFQTDHCDGANLAYWAGGGTYGEMSISPIEKPGYEIQGWATVNGHRVRVTFDTGAWRSTLKTSAAKAAGIALDEPGVVPGGASDGIGRRFVSTEIAPVASFEIGGEEIKNTHLRIGDLDLEDADMLIGADFFLSHRVFVSKSQRKIFFTYNGGPVFSLDTGGSAPPPPPRPAVAPVAVAAAGAPAAAAPPDPASDAPTDAIGFDRRGEAFVARREFDQAIADFTRATELAPTDPRGFEARAAAHLMNHQPLLAMADFTQVLKLKPDDAPALLARGQLRLAIRDEAGAREDFGEALRLAPALGARVADAYVRGGFYDDALAEYDRWIAAYPKNEDAAPAYSGRCWARTLQNRDLDKARADCDQALRLRPDDPASLERRGLAHLRLAEYDPAIADFNAALRIDPKTPWSLYGRGLAELRKGLKDQGDADLAAAAAIAPRLPERAKEYGLTP